MIVGGVAAVFYGHVRTGRDLDIWIKETPDNRAHLVDATAGINIAGAEKFLNTQLTQGWSTVTIGENGFIPDYWGYTKAFKANDFDECYKRARKGVFDSIPLTVIHLDDLNREKRKLLFANTKRIWQI